MERERRLYVFGAHRNDDGVPGVVAARAARAYVDLGGQDVHQLALALVSPLRAKHDRDCDAPRSNGKNNIE